MRQMRRKPAAFRKTRAEGGKTPASTRASPISGSRARSSRAARICALRTIAVATGRPPGTRSRWTPRPAISDSGASSGAANDGRAAIRIRAHPELGGRRAVRRVAGSRSLSVRMVARHPSPVLGRHLRSCPRSHDVPLLPAADDGAARGAPGRHPGCAARPSNPSSGRRGGTGR